MEADDRPAIAPPGAARRASVRASREPGALRLAPCVACPGAPSGRAEPVGEYDVAVAQAVVRALDIGVGDVLIASREIEFALVSEREADTDELAELKRGAQPALFDPGVGQKIEADRRLG